MEPRHPQKLYYVLIERRWSVWGRFLWCSSCQVCQKCTWSPCINTDFTLSPSPLSSFGPVRNNYLNFQKLLLTFSSSLHLLPEHDRLRWGTQQVRLHVCAVYTFYFLHFYSFAGVQEWQGRGPSCCHWEDATLGGSLPAHASLLPVGRDTTATQPTFRNHRLEVYFHNNWFSVISSKLECLLGCPVVTASQVAGLESCSSCYWTSFRFHICISPLPEW